MIMFEQFNLKDDAFPVTPSNEDGISWFGFEKLKEEFEGIFKRSYTETSRLCILNRGRLGAGKTHAAKYFEDKFAQQKIEGIYSCIIPIVIETPKQPQKAFIDFSHRLFNKITFRQIMISSSNLRALIEKETLFTDLLTITGSEDIAMVLSSMDEQNLLISKAYLLGGGTQKELREIGAAKKLTSEHEFSLAVIGVIYLLIHGKLKKIGKISRVLLWVDEMEDLVYFPTRYYLPFTQALREIIDNLNKHMTLMMNFTFSEPEELPTIGNILGEAIMQRINHHIVFPEPTQEDFKSYLSELLKANRLEKLENKPSTFPFSIEAFKLLIESDYVKTPRDLNKLCDSILRDLANRPGTCIEKQGEISKECLIDILPQILSLLEGA
jgi:hypothetical protein